jgi:O-acetyl-ADP-ribose deacetylase
VSTAPSIAPPDPISSPSAGRFKAAPLATPRSRTVTVCARHVIHAVGPVWHGGTSREDELLAGCYRHSLELAGANKLQSIAFPAISTGVYRFPAHRAARIAVSTVVGEAKAGHAISRVIFCCFSEDAAKHHADAFATLGLSSP